MSAGVVEVIFNGSIDAAIAAIERCDDVDAIYALRGKAALHVVCLRSPRDRVEIARALVSRGADVNIRSLPSLLTPLHCAVELNRLDLVQYLLECGADVEALDADGFPPIQYAFFYNDVSKRSIALALIEAGSRVDFVSTHCWSALHMAAWHRDTPLLELLLEHGAITEYRRGGERALDIARLLRFLPRGDAACELFYDMKLRRRNIIARRRLEWRHVTGDNDDDAAILVTYQDLVRIFEHVTSRCDWAQLRLVSKQWRAAADETLPWRPLTFFEYEE